MAERGSKAEQRRSISKKRGRILQFTAAEGGFARLSAESQSLLLEVFSNQRNRAPRKKREETAAAS
jgi:hypothetical protein